MIIKVCGVRTAEIADAAIEAGADWIGVVIEPRSPRHATPVEIDAVARVVRGRASLVAVMVEPAVDEITDLVRDHGIDAVQAHGDVDRDLARAAPLPVIRAINPRSAAEAFTIDWWPDGLLLLDAPPGELPGGTGERVDLDVAAEVSLRRRVILAGGLGPDNVAGAIAAVRPAGVDASSALESSPGVKDVDRVVAYVRAARAAVPAR